MSLEPGTRGEILMRCIEAAAQQNCVKLHSDPVVVADTVAAIATVWYTGVVGEIESGTSGDPAKARKPRFPTLGLPTRDGTP